VRAASFSACWHALCVEVLPHPQERGIIRFVKMCEYTAAHVRDASRYVCVDSCTHKRLIRCEVILCGSTTICASCTSYPALINANSHILVCAVRFQRGAYFI